MIWPRPFHFKWPFQQTALPAVCIQVPYCYIVLTDSNFSPFPPLACVRMTKHYRPLNSSPVSLQLYSIFVVQIHLTPPMFSKIKSLEWKKQKKNSEAQKTGISARRYTWQPLPWQQLLPDICRSLLILVLFGGNESGTNGWRATIQWTTGPFLPCTQIF